MKTMPGLGAELAGAEGKGAEEILGQLGGPLAQRGRQHEDRISARHLSEAGDGVRARGALVHQRPAAVERAGESDGAYQRMLDQRRADFAPRAEKRGKGAVGQAFGGDGFGNEQGDHLTRAGVGLMRLDDDGAAGSEGGCGVAASHGEGEREVAGSKDDDGAERAQHRPQIDARHWLAIGDGGIDARLNPGTLFNQPGKEAKLAGGAADLSRESRHRQRGFKMRALGDLFLVLVERIGAAAQKCSARFAAGSRIALKGFGGKARGGVNLSVRGGVDRPDRERAPVCGFTAWKVAPPVAPRFKPKKDNPFSSISSRLCRAQPGWPTAADPDVLSATFPRQRDWSANPSPR